MCHQCVETGLHVINSSHMLCEGVHGLRWSVWGFQFFIDWRGFGWTRLCWVIPLNQWDRVWFFFKSTSKPCSQPSAFLTPYPISTSQPGKAFHRAEMAERK
jgi:hypothetical protein